MLAISYWVLYLIHRKMEKWTELCLNMNICIIIIYYNWATITILMQFFFHFLLCFFSIAGRICSIYENVVIFYSKYALEIYCINKCRWNKVQKNFGKSQTLCLLAAIAENRQRIYFTIYFLYQLFVFFQLFRVNSFYLR